MPPVQREVSDRTVFGKLVKWLFIGFNILMMIWIIVGWLAASHVSGGAVSSAERAGAAIGTGLGMMFLLFIWGIGDLILGLFVLFTRRKKIITVEE
jgi:hypothetical protein